MLKVILTVGIPASSKTTWARKEIENDPDGTVRINRDDLRNMLFNYHFSSSNEKMVTRISDYALSDAIKRGKNVILDNTNLNKRNFDDVCKMVKALNVEAMVMEKPFYVDLEEALRRDAARTGTAQVGEAVIKKFWKQSGGKQHQFYKPRMEIFNHTNAQQASVMIQDINLQKAAIIDMDGTLCEISHRSPYDASKCLDDSPIVHVIELVQLFYNNGYKIIFCSGREDKYRDLSKQWLDTYVAIPEYELFMRPTGDMRKDSIIKEEIFNNHIKDKYYVRAIIDDRLQVCEMWYRLGLPLFRVNDPQANF